MKSLDPRVNRLPKIGVPGRVEPKAPMDQFGTFEVFVQPRDGKPFQHEGIVHAPDLELAYVLAKEAFTRRFQCVSLYVTDTRHVHVSPMSEGAVDVHELLPPVAPAEGPPSDYEIYYLGKRGKQHIHSGQVTASSPLEAMHKAKDSLRRDKIVYNVWAIRTNAIRFTMAAEKDLWITLPEKKFRDAADYKGGDKLKEFLERSKTV